jgi:hypothetical protein
MPRTDVTAATRRATLAIMRFTSLCDIILLAEDVLRNL